MHTAATHVQSTPDRALFLAFELSEAHWKLGFSTVIGQSPRQRVISARDLSALEREIRLAKQRFKIAAEAPVFSCYEAGRDGFWLHRHLASRGIENLVVDSSSIEVPRRHRRRKTDQMDLAKLMKLLLRHHAGERKVWSVVHVPGEDDEDRRQLHRELATLRKGRTAHINRIQGLLAAQGVRLAVGKNFLKEMGGARTWRGEPLPPFLQARLKREYQRKLSVEGQIEEIEAERLAILRQSEDPWVQMARDLMRLKSVGVNSGWTFVMEFFSWRKFNNAREVGALAGVTPTPYQSGDMVHELGMSKAGNVYVRALLIQIAWAWLRYQPDSELSQWYEERFGQGGSRLRRVDIVALARKLLIAFWRYLEHGEIPAGAQLMPLSL